MANIFVWYELMTADPAAAADYYSHVVGWNTENSGMAGDAYTVLKVGDRQVAGIMGKPPGTDSMPPSWFGYIGVDDVDGAAEILGGAGGAVHKGPADIPRVGRFAVVADPQGAVFMLFKGDGDAPAALPYMTPGSIGWHELHTGDVEAGFAFYAGQFGWEKADALDMGPMGVYQLWRAGQADAIGGMVREDSSYWLFYFAVEDIDAGTARLAEKGGTILHGPVEVPGGAWITMARDPQGAMFAIVGMKGAGNAGGDVP